LLEIEEYMGGQFTPPRSWYRRRKVTATNFFSF